LLAGAQAAPALTFSPPEWKFGMIRQGDRIQGTVSVGNHTDRPLTVSFIPTCTCLTVSPSAQEVPAGGRAVFTMDYDSVDDVGITIKGYLVRSDPPAGAEPVHYLLRGVVRTYRAAAASTGAAETGASRGAWSRREPAPAAAVQGVSLFYYYTPGCRSCEEFLSTEIPRWEKKLGIRIDMRRRDVLDTAAFEELSAFASAHGQKVHAIPALRMGETLLQGDTDIRAGLEGLLVSAAPRPAPAAAAAEPAPVGDRLALLPVIAAGLIDGINPCAFTTLIFLLASLALGGRGRREVLLIGALFSFAVFLTYFAVGLGFFAALRAASVVSLVSLLLRWVLVAALVVFAALSIYDFTLIRAGRPAEMLLQLPKALKRQIHASVRTHVRTAALVGSSLVLGFLVSLFEFACTGQVYLPLLGYLARVHRQGDAIGLLLIYNLCFIAPLLVVFAASYFGVSSGRITTLFQRHMGTVKLLLAVVFLGLAVFTLVG
jgi:cytochrome c biogenesis protein CcdA